MNPKKTIIDPVLIQQWFLSKPHLPLMRGYISLRVEDLSLNHAPPQQNVQLVSPTTLSELENSSENLATSQIIQDSELEEINLSTPQMTQAIDLEQVIDLKDEIYIIHEEKVPLAQDFSVSVEADKARLDSTTKPYLSPYSKRIALVSFLIFTLVLFFVIAVKKDGSSISSPEGSSNDHLIDDSPYKPNKQPTLKTTAITVFKKTKKLPTFKYSPHKLWHKFYSHGERNGANALCVTPDNSVIVGGWTKWPNLDALILKIDVQNGQLLWQQTFGSNQDDSVKALTVTPDGGIIVTGHKSYSSSSNVQEKDLWVFKLEAQNGQMRWKKNLGDYENDGGLALDSFSNGDVVVAGWTDSKGSGKADGWLLRLNSQDGQIIWDKTLGSSEADVIRAVKVTGDDNIIIAGTTQSPYYHWNAWVLKLDKRGRTLWEKTFGGNYEAQAHALQIMPEGDIVIAGYIKKTTSRQEAWTFRLSGDGDTQRWQKVWGGSGKHRANALQLTSDDGVIVAGESLFEQAKKPKAWILKLDARGHQSWKLMLDDVNGKAYALQATSDEELIIAGYGESSERKQTWVLKFGE
jgi:uncharacterized delta-60 repeat protein